MKRLLAIIMVITLSFCLMACSFDDEPITVQGDEQTSEEITEEVKEEKTLGINGSAEFKKLKFTATEIKESTGTDFFVPEEGNIFVGVKFTIENISEEEQSVSSLLLFESYIDDVKSTYSVSAACVFDEGTLDGTVAAGKKLVGWYSVEAPENWSEIEISVKGDWLSDKAATFVFNK